MAQLSTFRKVALGALAGATMIAATYPASAQQTANASTLPTLENAGQVAAALCARRGDTSVNCIRLESNKIVEQIGAQARAQLQSAQAVTRCIEQLQQAKAANPADFQAAKAAAGVTRIEEGNECLVASKLPQRRADTAPVPALSPTQAALRQ